jgi:hypothetical protein
MNDLLASAVPLPMIEFLAGKGANLLETVSGVDAALGLQPEDVLLAVGSVVEGLGNSKSDLDLLLISSRPADSLPRDVAVIVGECLSDVQILHASELEVLLAKLHGWAELPWDVTHRLEFSIEERRLLHRLLNHAVLFEGASSRLASLLPTREPVGRLKLQVARHLARTIQIDMAGNREVEDYVTLVLGAQELLGHAVDALLAGYYQTNPNAKWRSRLLNQLPAEWEKPLRLRPSGLSASQMFWLLHQTPERPDRESAIAYALRIASFARSIFVWAERKVLSPVRVSNFGPHEWYSGDRDSNRRRLPCLDLDVDFFECSEGAALGRLNEFGNPTEVSAREFEIALLFDGVTSLAEAKYAVCGPQASEVEEHLVEQIVVRLRHAGLVVPVHALEGPDGDVSCAISSYKPVQSKLEAPRLR